MLWYWFTQAVAAANTATMTTTTTTTTNIIIITITIITITADNHGLQQQPTSFTNITKVQLSANEGKTILKILYLNDLVTCML